MSSTAHDCISNLENHVHEEFASLRFSGRDFAYSVPKAIFSKIDMYCDDLTVEECRTPLMIVGPSGVGKSALLANWMHRRISMSNRNRSGEEYIFWHAVGCSRQSLNTNHMLRRLMMGLKAHFDLEQKQLPVSQEKLSWELPRFLELASRKGKVIILIDGLHRLRNADDTEDRLSWLPLELPSNVKVLLTVTSNPQQSPNDQSGQASRKMKGKSSKCRILMELERREVPCLKMPNLDSELCRQLLDSYLHNHTSNEETSKVSGLNSIDGASLALLGGGVSGAPGGTSNNNVLKGFLLFESQISQLVSHPLGGNPQFLRLFLRCLDFVCQRGYSIWLVFNDWIQATGVADLVIRILETCEQGHTKTRESAQWACDQTLLAGGLKGLKELYPWHPQLSEKLEQDHERSNGDDRNDLHSQPKSAEHAGVSQPSNHKFDKKEALQIRASIEIKSNQTLESALLSASNLASLDEVQTSLPQSNEKLISLIVSRIPRERLDSATERKVPRTRSASHDNNSVSSADNESLPMSQPEHATHEHMSAMSSSDEESDFEHDPSHAHSPVTMTPLGSKKKSHPTTENSKTNTSADQQHAGNASPLVPFTNQRGNNNTANGNGHRNNNSSSQNRRSSETGVGKGSMDPGDGFFSLPLYMRGGVNSPGLGDVLGSALSLLLVCRHGLKEKELWAILNDLQVLLKAKKRNTERKREKEHEEHLRSSLQGIVTNQGSLDRVLKSEDIQKRGYLSKDMLFRCVNKFVKLNASDFELLMTYIFRDEIKKEYGLNPEASTSVLDFDEIDYESFLNNAVKLNRKWRDSNASYRGSNGGNNRLQDVLLEDGNHEENYDDFQLHVGASAGRKASGGRTTRKGTFDSSLKKSESKFDGLGPVVEELLLQILCALGVLYIHEYKVLVLPSDSEPFREAIQHKYIANSGENSLLYWHNLIVKHFLSQPNCLRKCEELPWHLKICRKWNLLKDCLVDLTTFDLMFQNDLRDELTDYWLLLTEGPLVMGSESSLLMNLGTSPQAGGQKAHGSATSDMEGKESDGLTTYSALLQEIDEAISAKVPLKEVRRKHRENEVSRILLLMPLVFFNDNVFRFRVLVRFLDAALRCGGRTEPLGGELGQQGTSLA